MSIPRKFATWFMNINKHTGAKNTRGVNLIYFCSFPFQSLVAIIYGGIKRGNSRTERLGKKLKDLFL
jgi:hypothetical protein